MCSSSTQTPRQASPRGSSGPPPLKTSARKRALVCLFEDSFDPDPARLIRATSVSGVSILPGSFHLDAYNRPDPGAAEPFQAALRCFLDEVRTDFDVILIDCPPNLYLCSWNAGFIAADFVVVPFQPEDYGSQGIAAMRAAVAKVRSRPNPGLRLLGYLLTMVQRRLGLHAAYERQLRQLYGSDVFEVSIPRAKDFAEAVSARMPITRWKPRSVGARAIADLASEMERRVAELNLGLVRPDVESASLVAGGVPR